MQQNLNLAKYYPLVQLFHKGFSNKKISKLHYTLIQIIYDENSTSFEELLTRDEIFFNSSLKYLLTSGRNLQIFLWSCLALIFSTIFSQGQINFSLQYNADVNCHLQTQLQFITLDLFCGTRLVCHTDGNGQVGKSLRRQETKIEISISKSTKCS